MRTAVSSSFKNHFNNRFSCDFYMMLFGKMWRKYRIFKVI